jgi:hypothetical protein
MHAHTPTPSSKISPCTIHVHTHRRTHLSALTAAASAPPPRKSFISPQDLAMARLRTMVRQLSLGAGASAALGSARTDT